MIWKSQKTNSKAELQGLLILVKLPIAWLIIGSDNIQHGSHKYLV